MSSTAMQSIRKVASMPFIRRQLTLEAMAKSFGQKAVNNIYAADDFDSLLDVPTIAVADPATQDSWKWKTCLHLQPTQSLSELAKFKSRVDPFELVDSDLSHLSDGIKDLLGSDHAVLEKCAKYFFEIDGGKKIRPTMVLLMSYALNTIPGSDVLALQASPKQKRLAEITEMIHTASLFHDDVIDKADTRRGVSSVNQVFGNKLAILGGDFLLSRASVALARLRNFEVVEVMSTVIEHLVKGEILQMKNVNKISNDSDAIMETYLRKNYYKTASLMGNSCLSAAVLGQASHAVMHASYLFGTYVGQAFQLVDDGLDFEGSAISIGKAPLADLKSGLATAPTIFACQEYPQLIPMILRKFEGDGDIESTYELVVKSQGLRRTRELAQVHAEHAIAAIQALPPSDARDALIALAIKVVTRNK